MGRENGVVAESSIVGLVLVERVEVLVVEGVLAGGTGAAEMPTT